MLKDPLSNGSLGALATHEGGSNEGEEERPGITFAASFAWVGDIDNSIHQAALLGVVHHVFSFSLGGEIDCT